MKLVISLNLIVKWLCFFANMSPQSAKVDHSIENKCNEDRI